MAAIVSTTDGGTFTYTFLDDAFPAVAFTTRVPLLVRPVDDAYFRRVDGSELTVFIPRAGDPAHDLDRAQRRELDVHFAGDLDTP